MLWEWQSLLQTSHGFGSDGVAALLSVCLDENLTGHSKFYSDHRVTVSTYRYCQFATFRPLAFCDCSLFFTILILKEFRIATSVAMFTTDLNAGVVPQMSPPPHDLERLRTTMVDFIVLSIKLVFMVLGVSYSRVLAQYS